MKIITTKQWAEFKRVERVWNKRISRLELNQQYGKLVTNGVWGREFIDPPLSYRVSKFFDVVSIYHGDTDPAYGGLTIDEAIAKCAISNIQAGKGFRYEIRRMI